MTLTDRQRSDVIADCLLDISYRHTIFGEDSRRPLTLSEHHEILDAVRRAERRTTPQ